MGSLRDYLWAAVPILLVVFVWMYGGFALGLTMNETVCPDRRSAAGTALDIVAVHHDYLPVDFTCEYADGTTYRYVPGGAKIAMYGALLGAVASLVTAMTISRRLSRRAWSSTSRTRPSSS